MIDAKLVQRDSISGTAGDRSANTERAVFTFMVSSEEVPDSAGVLDLIRFRVGPKGLLETLKVQCSSTNFDFVIREKSTEELLTIYDIIAVTGSNILYYNNTVNIPIINKDDLLLPEPYIYMFFDNQDAVNDPGNIIIELGITQI